MRVFFLLPSSWYQGWGSALNPGTLMLATSLLFGQTCAPHDPTAPCTISGLWFEDEVTFAGAGPVKVAFGAIDYQTSNFEQFQNIDGLVGMAGPSGISNTFSQLVKAGAVDEDVWCLCINPNGKTSNGTLTLGGIDPRFHVGEMLWTPNPTEAVRAVPSRLPTGPSVLLESLTSEKRNENPLENHRAISKGDEASLH